MGTKPVINTILENGEYDNKYFKQGLTIQDHVEKLIFRNCTFGGEVCFESNHIEFIKCDFEANIALNYRQETTYLVFKDCDTDSIRVDLSLWSFKTEIPSWLTELPANSAIFESSDVDEPTLLSFIESFNHIDKLSLPYAPKNTNRLRAICENLVYLKELSITGVQLSTKLNWLPALSNLRLLCVEGDQADGNRLNINIFPQEIFQLRTLTSLELSSTRICELPHTCPLDQLEHLKIANNALKNIPSSWLKKSLKSLMIQERNCAEVPRPIRDLIKLECLILVGFGSNDELRLNNLVQLKKLHLIDLKLEKLPSGIPYLTELKELSLANNSIKLLPSKLCKLQNLQVLKVNDNQLKHINNTVLLDNLTRISAQNNQIISIPDVLYMRSEAKKLQINLMQNPLPDYDKIRAIQAYIKV